MNLQLLRRIGQTRRTSCSQMRRNILTLLLFCGGTILFCEYLIYYFVIWRCSWHVLKCDNQLSENGPADEDPPGSTPGPTPLHVMILSDPHLLGKWAHWLDKLYREWEMQRSFQTALQLLHPDVVFVLGDLFDSGQNTNNDDFEKDVSRFRRMFEASVPIYCVVGNHDIGFHYRALPFMRQRFEKAFGMRSVHLVEISDVNFVLINSIAFESDGCSMCAEAEDLLVNVSVSLRCKQLSSAGNEALPIWRKTHCPQTVLGKSRSTLYSKPIIMQHYPLFRKSDELCGEGEEDAEPPEEKQKPFREKFDCMSREATDIILKQLEPRAVFGGHTHRGCYREHKNGIPEWSVSSFNWRNNIHPTILLVSVCSDSLKVSKCFLPKERIIFMTYGCSGAILALWGLLGGYRMFRRFKVRSE